MPKRGENIYKRKDHRWEGRYIKGYDEKGKARYGYVYASTYADVKKKLNDAKSNNKGCIETGKNIMYSSLITNWTTMLRINTKESTFARYHHLIYSHIVPKLGDKPINKITNPIIEDFLNELISNGRIDGNGGLSNKTVADILVLIKRSLKYASDCGYQTNCKLSNLSIKNSPPDMRVFTIEEQKTLHNYLTTNIDREKFGILLSLYTGIRIGELCALKWENIDTTRGVLQVRKTMIRIQNVDHTDGAKTKLIISEPKSKCSIRDIPIPECLETYITIFEGSPSEYVLSGSFDQVIEPRTMQNKFHKHLMLCGVIDANFHALRHTFATRCVEIGFEIKSLSEVLGHTNVNITLNRYVHPSIELKRVNMQKLNSVII